MTCQHPCPFTSSQSLPSLYRYRKWALGSDLDLVVRTHVDAAVQQSGAQEIELPLESSAFPLSETQFTNIYSLLEYDSRVSNTPEWRQKLDSMKGAVLATEFKNNSAKLAKWTVESILSGSDQMRIGFISRVNPKDRKRHSFLGNAVFKPLEFAQQMNVNLGSGWGIAKVVLDMCSKLSDGKYILVKDPNKPLLRLYSVPSSSLDDAVLEESIDSVVDAL